jgi:hypothetical protein
MFWKMFILLDTLYKIADVWDMVRQITINKSWEDIFLGSKEDECLELVL